MMIAMITMITMIKMIMMITMITMITMIMMIRLSKKCEPRLPPSARARIIYVLKLESSSPSK